jgi:hypothetical protein
MVGEDTGAKEKSLMSSPMKSRSRSGRAWLERVWMPSCIPSIFVSWFQTFAQLEIKVKDRTTKDMAGQPAVLLVEEFPFGA